MRRFIDTVRRYGLRHAIRRLLHRPRKMPNFVWFHNTAPASADSIRYYFQFYARAFNLSNFTHDAAGRRDLNKLIGTDRWLWREYDIYYYYIPDAVVKCDD